MKPSILLLFLFICIANCYGQEDRAFVQTNKTIADSADKKIAINKFRDSISKYYYNSAIEETKKQNEAIRLFDSTIKMNEKSAETYYSRGNLKKTMQNYKEAEIDFNFAIKIDPNYELAYKERGMSKFKLNNIEGALADFSKAIDINPNSGENFFNRGIVNIVTKQFNKACIDLNKAVSLKYSEAAFFIKTYCNK